MTMKCFVQVMLWLSLSLVMLPAVEAQELEHDPFQRRLVFYNDTPVTIWPVFQAPQDSNCKAELPGKLLRIHVNSRTRDRGIPPGESVTVALPKRWPCKFGGFYDAVRIFVFVVDVQKFELKLKEVHQDNQVTTLYDHDLHEPICGSDQKTDPCWTGTADAAYALDSPAQLLEYTIISQDSKGVAFLDPNDPKGVPFIDFDVSYVDEAYLPAVMAIDTGAVQYMGSSLSYLEFNKRLGKFITGTGWPEYAAYVDLNFKADNLKNRTVFADLLTENGVGQYPRVPSGHQAVENTFTGGGSPFYKPSWDGTSSTRCKDPDQKSNLLCSIELPTVELCCPDVNGDMQGCCDAKNYLIDKVTAMYDVAAGRFRYSGQLLKDLTGRFTRWTVQDVDCAASPPRSPVIGGDQVQFCNAFKQTARFAWKAFAAQDAALEDPICTPLSAKPELYNQCLTATIIGYRIDTKQAKNFAERCKTCPDNPSDPDKCPAFCTIEKQLNESVQGLLRGVPWTSKGDPDTCRQCPSASASECPLAECVWKKTEDTSERAKLWQFDKFLHFWAPYDSAYNLVPYTRVIHDPNGLDAPGAYSFSIDDFYGNFGGPGTKVIIDVGGTSRLPNPEPFDPYTQYHVTVGPGWDHLKLCVAPDGSGGLRIDIPKVDRKGIALGTPLSFFVPDGKRHDPCVIAAFDKSHDETFVKYELREVSYDVTDTYTGLSQRVKGLSGVAAVRTGNELVPTNQFCEDNSTEELVTKGTCTGNLSPVGRGNRDAYNGVEDHCNSQDDATCGRPLLNLSVPALSALGGPPRPPGPCVTEASIGSLTCRSNALALRLEGATDLGRTKITLMRQAAKVDRLLLDAEAQIVAGNVREARTRLKKAGRVVIAIGFRLRSLSGRQQIAAATRAELQATIAALDADLETLRRAL